jgi:septal ring factor EnvC (AmiA/AmiB activator)
MNADCRNLADDNIFLQEEIAHLERERKYAQDSCKTIMKSINKEHKDFKKLEHSNQAVVDLNKELETKIGGTEKLIEELI